MSINIEKEEYKIYGINWKYFLLFSIITLIVVWMGKLPKGMNGALPLMVILGGLLNELGNKTPIIKDYFGGGPIVMIFGTAILSTYLLPVSSVEIMSNFLKGGGFLTFIIVVLITGSILGMDRSLLLKSAIRYIPAILGGLVCAFLLVGIGGLILGDGFIRSIVYIGIPIMGGGMGAGAVPISQIFAKVLNSDTKAILSEIVPALALGNAFAVIAAGLLNKLGKAKPSLTGNGKLMKNSSKDVLANANAYSEDKFEYNNIIIGIFVSAVFLLAGIILSVFIPVHYYALMIILVVLAKVFNWLPRKLIVACFQWYSVAIKNFIPLILVGIGCAYIDINVIVSAITFKYVFLVLLTIIGSIIGSGIVGHFVGFYFVESALSAGLCMANMGGSGDVAVLGAADRMELMPFAQISSRLGGALIIIIATVLINLVH